MLTASRWAGGSMAATPARMLAWLGSALILASWRSIRASSRRAWPMVSVTSGSPPPWPSIWESWLLNRARRTATPCRSPLVGSSSIWSSSSTASRWALTRVVFRNDCSLKMTVVRLTLA